MTTSLDIAKKVVIDLETTNRNHTFGTFSASPWYDKNEILLRGRYFPIADDFDTWFAPYEFMAGSTILVIGHNLKFDLSYLIAKGELTTTGLWDLQIWDTMVADWAMSGQSDRRLSLNALAEKYGIDDKKDELLSKHLADGGRVEDIPKDRLEEYLEQDCRLTWKVFAHQEEILKREASPQFLQHLDRQMELVKALTLMEYNGIQFDLDTHMDNGKEVGRKVASTLKSLKGQLWEKFNPASNDDVSLAIFGGIRKETIKVLMRDENGDVVRYKSGAKKGQERYKNEKVDIMYLPKISVKEYPISKRTKASKEGFYSTADAELRNVAEIKPELSKLILEILLYRSLAKDLKTYYTGYLKHYNPDTGRIHGSYNQCVTSTGRLSSSSPNLQNLTNKSEED